MRCDKCETYMQAQPCKGAITACESVASFTKSMCLMYRCSYFFFILRAAGIGSRSPRHIFGLDNPCSGRSASQYGEAASS